MTLGAKIQQLRKTNHLSQEQLAEALSVSRQAVSKWELCESLPDTEKIILLSNFFQVTTDYLLLPEKEIPQTRTTETIIQSNTSGKQVFLATSGLNIIGLFLSYIAWFTWQTVFTVSLGILLQCISTLFFVVYFSIPEKNTNAKMYKRIFYPLSTWLIAPFPIRFLVGTKISFYSGGISYIILTLLVLFSYFVFCVIITYLLNKKHNFTKS